MINEKIFYIKSFGEIFILSIGESESSDYVHALYGPSKSTSFRDILLSYSNWICFSNAYSTHTHTITFLKAALTN
jgi:glucan phosphoethanolaminetransferase (alkaline phosphatase superfamily)